VANNCHPLRKISCITWTAIAKFGGKTLVQLSQSLIGARLNNKHTKNEIRSTDLANTTPSISLVALDLTTRRQVLTNEILPTTVNEILPTNVDNADTKTEIVSQALYSKPTERITGLTALSDGTFILVTVAATQKGNHSKLVFTDNKSSKSKVKSKKVSGFKKSNATIEGVLASKDDKLIGIVSQSGGQPPFELVVINPKNAKVTSGADLYLPDLPSDIRFSNLALAPDGKIYATTLDRVGATTLVQLDPEKKSIITGKLLITNLAQLSYDKKLLQNDLLSLTFSPSGQLIALANFKNEKHNSVLSVDMETGEMSLLSKVVVDKIVFPRKSDKSKI
jgi:hypothetical protein